jgi:MSHA pilin protein MshA
MNKKGFTLIELILVIAILGILAVSALPKFLNLSEDAEEAARDGVVGAVRSGIALYRANDMITNGGAGTYPTSLEAGSCCFNSILTNPVEGWTAGTGGNYTHDGTSTNWAYDSTNGTFSSF